MSCYFMSQITYKGVLFAYCSLLCYLVNFKVMDVCKSFPYFSKVEFHVVYFLDRLRILTGIDKWTVTWIMDCIYEAVGSWHLREPHASHSIILISRITQTRQSLCIYSVLYILYFVGTKGCSILGTLVIF